MLTGFTAFILRVVVWLVASSEEEGALDKEIEQRFEAGRTTQQAPVFIFLWRAWTGDGLADNSTTKFRSK